VDRLGRELTARGHAVTVVAQASGWTRPPPVPEVPYRVYRHPRLPPRHAGVAGHQRYLLAAHERHRFDLVHCHGLYPHAFLAALARYRMGVPLVATSHGADLEPADLAFYGPLAAPWNAWGVRRMDALVAVNRGYAERFRARAPAAVVREIPNGVDVEALRLPAPRPPGLEAAIRPGGFVLFLGRLVGQKGVGTLLEAFARLPGDGGLRLVVGGEGRRRADLERRAAELGLDGRVSFLGWVEGPVKSWLLQSSLSAVVPSHGGEAFGLVVLESFAAGRPVVASDVPCLPERVAHGRTGLLVPEGSPEALAAALARLAAAPGEADAMGRRARAEGGARDWREVARRHEELYDELLERSGRRVPAPTRARAPAAPDAAPGAREVWAIGLYEGASPVSLAPAPGVAQPVLTHRDVTDLEAGGVADPFMVRWGGRWYLFFEAIAAATGKGSIALATSEDARRWRYEGIVLREPFHLSYPYVFEWRGEHFMVPETLDAGAVRLYRAATFPRGWTPVADLVPGRIADPSLFRHGGRWWLFGCTTPGTHRTLALFGADDLTGPWTEHPASPVVADDRGRARPAGRVILHSGRPIRFAQDCRPRYGSAIRAFEVLELTPEAYRERELPESPVLAAAGAGWNAAGMHHVDAHRTGPDRWTACVDGYARLPAAPEETPPDR
jgi:glycosyltransferase involved in cell wall biosynthesis